MRSKTGLGRLGKSMTRMAGEHCRLAPAPGDGFRQQLLRAETRAADADSLAHHHEVSAWGC